MIVYEQCDVHISICVNITVKKTKQVGLLIVPVCVSDQLVLPLWCSVPVALCSQSSLHYQLPTPGGAPQTAGNLSLNKTSLLLP